MVAFFPILNILLLWSLSTLIITDNLYTVKRKSGGLCMCDVHNVHLFWTIQIFSGTAPENAPEYHEYVFKIYTLCIYQIEQYKLIICF